MEHPAVAPHSRLGVAYGKIHRDVKLFIGLLQDDIESLGLHTEGLNETSMKSIDSRRLGDVAREAVEHEAVATRGGRYVLFDDIDHHFIGHHLPPRHRLLGQLPGRSLLLNRLQKRGW